MTNYTVEEARKAFNRSPFTIGDLTNRDMDALKGYLIIEMTRSNVLKDTISHLVSISYDKKDDYITKAYARVVLKNGAVVDAISIKANGDIDFCESLGDVFTQTFLRSFMKWLTDWLYCDRVFNLAPADAGQSIAALACTAMSSYQQDNETVQRNRLLSASAGIAARNFTKAWMEG